MRSLGLYIHIPFCKAKCIYCDFYSLPRAEGQMDAYVSALTAQLAAWRERTASSMAQKMPWEQRREEARAEAKTEAKTKTRSETGSKTGLEAGTEAEARENAPELAK